jgi:hypothetical protein
MMRFFLMFTALHLMTLKASKAEVFTDSVYRTSIKTVMLQVKGAEGSFPIIELGSADQLHLQFDDLIPEQRQLYYTIEHCNADWSISNTMFSYYLQGLQQDLIQDFRYSFNTRQQFLHYDLVFPNNNMRIILSGNYILKVFEDGDRENLVLTRRFMVYSNQVKISARVKRPSVIELRDTHQEIDALVQLENYKAINPATSMKLVIMQNYRWDNIRQLKPFGINSTQLNYDYDDGSNCFPGGNEYRAFDTRSLRQQSISVQNFNRAGELVEVTLLADPVRRFREYQFLQEINGRFFIRNSDGSGEPEVDADYALVRFRLPFEAPLKEGNLFLFGSFTDWQFKEGLRLDYDYELRSYTASILLKQGIYNYSYVLREPSAPKPDESFIEGSFFNTENDYLLLMYGRAYTNNFDELIGLSRIHTLRNP